MNKNQPWEAVKSCLYREERYVKNLQKYEPLSFNKRIYEEYDIKELYTIPLITANRVHGVLQVASTSKNPLKPEQKRLLRNIAEEIAAGISKNKS